MKAPYRTHAPVPRSGGCSDDYDEDSRPPLIVRFFKAALFYVVTALIFITLNLFVLRLGLVNGNSMEPTLHNKDLVVIWQLLYSPKTGDIIVTDKENELGISLTKRVVATGGQAVRIEGGTLYVNDTPQNEDFINELNWGAADLNLVVPDGEIFVMGDNRNASYDSRDIGTIPVSDIMGEVVLRIFPFSGFRRFE